MKYLMLPFRLAVYFCVFLYELIKANIIIAQLVFMPRHKFESAAIRFKSKMKTSAELVLITNSITLTPGTLVMDANLETGVVLIHALGKATTSVQNDIARFPESYALWAIRGK